jgi:hypothetical protein
MKPPSSPADRSGLGIRSVRLGQVLSILVGLVAPMAVLAFYVNPDPFAIPPIFVASLIAGSTSIVATYISFWKSGNVFVAVQMIILVANVILLGITLGILAQLF